MFWSKLIGKGILIFSNMFWESTKDSVSLNISPCVIFSAHDLAWDNTKQEFTPGESNKHFLTEPAIAGGLTKLEVIAICFTEFSELCGKLIKNVIRDASSCLQMVLFIGNFLRLLHMFLLNQSIVFIVHCWWIQLATCGAARRWPRTSVIQILFTEASCLLHGFPLSSLSSQGVVHWHYCPFSLSSWGFHALALLPPVCVPATFSRSLSQPWECSKALVSSG